MAVRYKTTGRQNRLKVCLYPKLIKNRKYIKNKKNKGRIPEMKDKRVQMVPVGCGDCYECRKQKTNMWRTRLHEELKHNKNKAIFVTLTFSNESYKELHELTKGYDAYNHDNEIATLAMRRYLERWRKKHKKSIRHWTITEIGGQRYENIHIHGILWTNESVEEIKKRWKYGYVWTSKEHKKGYVSERTINYIVKYLMKQDEKHPNYKPKVLTSPGIGKGYMKTVNYKQNKYNGKNTKEWYKLPNGAKINLPIYYRNKIYTEEEREQLWLNKLDKQVRYIDGKEIDVSTTKGEKIYEITLKHYQTKNLEWGFGNGVKKWNQKIYELERRKLKQWEKIRKAKNK